MGSKGEKMSSAAPAVVEQLAGKLAMLGDIRLKKMFGGYGVFKEDSMFALVTSDGEIFFKAGEANIEKYEKAGSPKHARMPYYQLPDEVFSDEESLIDWAHSSISVSQKGK